MIEIDGSYGEGGGQILRTALSLSCLFNRPFRIFNIRKGRKKPGLMPQHLTCVKASQTLFNADVIGNNVGSSELIFYPKLFRGGSFSFDVGTAGSTSLILQTIIPALIFLKEETEICLKGGTHVPYSPSFHYIAGIFAPFLKRIGVDIRLEIESYGFYPRGGGIIKAKIFPAEAIKPIRIVERGSFLGLKGYSGVGNLPLSIAERQRDAFLDRIRWLNCPAEIDVLSVSTPGQGTFIYIQSDCENSSAGFTALGQKGKRAEMVGEEAAKDFLEYFHSNAALDRYLPDQICLYLSLCRERSEFSTSCVTRHLNTNLWVIGLFNKFIYSVEGEVGEPGLVRIN